MAYFSFANFIFLMIYVLYGVEHIRKSKLALPYSLLFISLALWCFGSTFFYTASNLDEAVFWYGFSSLGWLTFPACSLHLFLVFGKVLLTKKERKMSVFLYLVPAVLLVCELVLKKHIMYTEVVISTSGLGYTVQNRISNPLAWIYIIYLIVYFALGFWAVRKWSRETNYQSEKIQSILIILASLFTIMIGMFTDIILPFFSTFLPPVSNLFLIIIVVAIFQINRKFSPFEDPGIIKANTILNSMSDPVIFFNAESKIIKINQAVTTLLGYTLQDLYFKELLDILSDYKYNEENIRYLIEHKQIRDKELMVLCLDKTALHVIYSASLVMNEDQEFVGYIITFKDMTAKKEREQKILDSNHKYKKVLEELHYLVNCDQLTGLLNRGSFYRKLKQLEYKYKQTQEDFAIMFGDLNGFKFVNDTYGHDLGDLLLVETAKRLKECLNEEDFVYRIGGDEFVIIYTKNPSTEKLKKRYHQIKSTFQKQFQLEKNSISVGISLGTAVYSQNEKNIDQMIKVADQMMYAEKWKEKNAAKTPDKSE